MSKYLNLKPVEFDALSAAMKKRVRWEGRMLLPKYDGCFAMVAFENGKPAFILSRTGERVKSMDHVFDALVQAYPWLDGTRGGVMVLGEAWSPAYEFAEISGIFRRQYAQPQLGFASFDVVGWGGTAKAPVLDSRVPYSDRVGTLIDKRNVEGAYGIHAPNPVYCESEEHAWQYARSFKELGPYDGAIAADPAAFYIPGSGKAGEFLKLKPLLSYTLECVGYEEAKGEKTGRATGALVVRFKNGAKLKVATGLSEAEQANLKQFVGKLIEVEAMGASSKGLLREPRFKGVRDDVEKADY